MSDDLAVGGAGSTTVVTTALAEEARAVAHMASELGSCLNELAALDRVVGAGMIQAADAPRSVLMAEEALHEAERELSGAQQECEVLARGVTSAAQSYEVADRIAHRLGQELAAQLGYFLGAIAPVLVGGMLPGLVIAGAAGAAGFAILPEGARGRARSNLAAWFRQNSAVLSDPEFVQAVRLSVMSADDAGWGLVHAPPGFAGLVGDEGLKLAGVTTSAGVVAGIAGSVGVLRETGVTVTAGKSVSGPPGGEGVLDRASRIPQNAEQVRIERYSIPGQQDRFEVYLAGTADLAVGGDDEPWDMTSNMTAMAGGSSGSYRAVVDAMAMAGIDSTSPVTLTGYSQGGLVAAQLAASGDYCVDGLVTFGAPAGQVAVPHDIPYLAVEHTNDLVPALGGTFASSDPVIVRRQLFDGVPPATDFALPAHQLSNYQDTASLVDESANSTIEAVLTRLHHAPARSVTTTLYHAVRSGG